jgi:hypothetical protein
MDYRLAMLVAHILEAAVAAAEVVAVLPDRSVPVAVVTTVRMGMMENHTPSRALVGYMEPVVMAGHQTVAVADRKAAMLVIQAPGGMPVTAAVAAVPVETERRALVKGSTPDLVCMAVALANTVPVPEAAAEVVAVHRGMVVPVKAATGPMVQMD